MDWLIYYYIPTKTFPMDRTYAVALYRVAVFFGAVAFVGGEIVVRVLFVLAGHVAISGDLG